MQHSRGALCAIVLAALLACAPAVQGGRELKQAAPAPEPECATIAYLAGNNANLTILAAALNATGLLGTLDDPFLPTTVFAPVDTAFQAFLASQNTTASAILANPALLPILLYHVVPGVIPSTILANGDQLLTLLGQNLTVAVSNASTPVVKIEAANSTATVTQADIPACQGFVHLIDTVLVPDIINSTAPAPGTTFFVVGDGSGNPADNELFVEEVVSP